MRSLLRRRSRRGWANTVAATGWGESTYAELPWDKVDAVPQRLSDELIWQSVFGPGSAVPPAGPNHSPEERARTNGALRLLRQGKSARAWLLKGGD